jgi:hypothetical protein
MIGETAQRAAARIDAMIVAWFFMLAYLHYKRTLAT